MTETNGSGDQASNLEQKVIKQVEYYFGDINLARDKFLLEEIKKDDGWVTMETMLKFKRLTAISDDSKVITDALKKSTAGLMEVNEEGDKIRRDPTKALPENNKERREDLKLRTVYAKGFPVKATLDELMEFCDKVGKAEHVKMRRDQLKEFKGSCFIVYHDQESAKKFLEGEECKAYGETELKKMYQHDYFKGKEDEKRVEKEARIKDKEEKKKQKEEAEDEQFKETITPGAILFVKGIPADTSREELKALFEGHARVAYADFDKGDKEGKLRFEEADSAQKAVDAVKAANDGKFTLKETELECSVLEGDDEVKHWKIIFAEMKERKEKAKFQRGRKRNQRGRGPSRGGPPHKRRREDN